jgi:hypothetical protein
LILGPALWVARHLPFEREQRLLDLVEARRRLFSGMPSFVAWSIRCPVLAQFIRIERLASVGNARSRATSIGEAQFSEPDGSLRFAASSRAPP